MLRSDTFHWLFVHSLSVPIHHVSEEHGGRDLRHKRAQAFSFLLKAHFFFFHLFGALAHVAAVTKNRKGCQRVESEMCRKEISGHISGY